jgi:hypothetical protein
MTSGQDWLIDDFQLRRLGFLWLVTMPGIATHGTGDTIERAVNDFFSMLDALYHELTTTEAKLGPTLGQQLAVLRRLRYPLTVRKSDLNNYSLNETELAEIEAESTVYQALDQQWKDVQDVEHRDYFEMKLRAKAWSMAPCIPRLLAEIRRLQAEDQTR